MQYLTCTNDGCTAEDEVVTVTGHLRPCDRVLCTKCGQPMEITFRRVYKYRLERCGGPQNPELPNGAEIVHIAMQGDSICIWALVDVREDVGNRKFIIYGTGHPITTAGKHIGTVLDGRFVWHVFEAL